MLTIRKKKSVKTSIINKMKELGIYKKEYMEVIDVFAGMIQQYETFEHQFEESGFMIEEEYTNKAGATNMRKTPLYTAMESLRKDIATYSNLLCLNPKALQSIKFEQESKSTLASVLDSLE